MWFKKAKLKHARTQMRNSGKTVVGKTAFVVLRIPEIIKKLHAVNLHLKYKIKN